MTVVRGALYLGANGERAARFTEILQGAGVVLTRAAGEQEVLAASDEHQPAVVLMDLASDPGISVRSVRQIAASGAAVIVIAEESAALAAIHQGAWDYVLGNEREQARDLPLKVRRALEFCRMQREYQATQRMIADLSHRQEMVKSQVLSRELVSAIGHELKNPLSALLGYSQVLVDEERGKVGEIAERLVVNVQRLLEMVDNLLDTLRAQVGGVPLTRVATDFNLLVGMGVSEVTSSHLCEDRRIEFQPATLLPTIWLDRRRVLRLTKTLLESSLAATAPDESLLVITALEDNEVTLRIVSGESARTSVGSAVFPEPRLEGSAAVAVAIARVILAAHGGKVQFGADSASPVSVVVRLPIEQKDLPVNRESVPALHESESPQRKSR